jgi:multidrug resistance efflux pump
VKERQQLEAQIARLQVKSPLTGVVKELRLAIGEEAQTVTLRVQPMAATPTGGGR